MEELKAKTLRTSAKLRLPSSQTCSSSSAKQKFCLQYQLNCFNLLQNLLLRSEFKSACKKAISDD